MDLMERTVIKIFIITMLIATGFEAKSQSQIVPAFKYTNPKTHRPMNLRYFLGTFSPVKLEDCLFAWGTFRFKVNSNGKIDTIEVTGDLPDVLINSIKTRIKETKNYWVVNNKVNELEEQKWFVLPFFIMRQATQNCPDNKTIEDTFTLINQLFDEDHQILITPTSYLIQPIWLFAAI